MDSFTKTSKHKDQVKIELEKLVPFGDHSFDLFRGQRLEDMIDEISECDPIDIIDGQIVGGAVIGIRIIAPIIVRPTTDVQYEILDGHYRVAAARKLKKKLQLQSVKIPAIVKEDLTDEEILSYVSETNPVGLLLKHGIDIFCDDYRETDGYKRLAGALVCSDGNSSMALDEYIEHFLLDAYHVYDLYESVYNMGNPAELTEAECSDEAVDTVRMFVRKDSGYIQQLKKYLNFDLDAYDYDDIQNQRERAKIFYFIHTLKKKFSGINILQLLGRPSMENIDNSFLGWETSNGKYVKFVKHEIEKELSLSRKSNIRKAVSYVVNT